MARGHASASSDLSAGASMGRVAVGKVARAARHAICIFSLFGLQAATPSKAAVVSITGDAFDASSFPGYGTSVGVNNVVNFGPSGLLDTTRGRGWFQDASLNVSASSYQIDWYFAGAESGDAIRFQPFNFVEANQNNNHNSGNDPGWSRLGTTTGAAPGTLPIALIDETNNSFIASFMLAYVEPIYRHGRLLGWRVVRHATDWFAFGFNDAGSSDSDFDDFMGIGHVTASTQVTNTPLPGALPLLATALGAGGLLRCVRLRRLRAIA